MQFLVKGHLKNFQRLQIALVISYGLLKYLVFDKITRFFFSFFVVLLFIFWNHVSPTLCCYLQVVPCHFRLRARFHIRLKRYARRVGQVRHFSMKICVLKTRAKPITKTLHENVIVNFPEAPAFLRKSAQETDFVHFLCVARQISTYMKTTVRPIGSLYLPDLTLKDNLENKTKETNLRN